MSVLKAPLAPVAPAIPVATVVPAAAPVPTVPGERVFMRTADDEGRDVVATLHALYRQRPAETATAWDRWGWESVRRADWSASQRTLTLRALVAADAEPVLRLSRGARLAAFAVERVAASLLVDAWVTLDDGRVARVIGRCRPGAAEPSWVVALPGGAVDPWTDELVTAAIIRLRRSHGL